MSFSSGPVNLPAIDETLAHLCAADLGTFIREAWPIVEPAQPFVSSWHIDTVAEHLMAVSAGELPRLIINQPPRTTKSLTCAVLWPSWEWLKKPWLRWLYASYAQDFAQRDSLKMREVISSQGGKLDGGLFERVGYQGVLRLLGENWSLKKDQNAKKRYETTAAGLRFATSVGGMATGEGGDRIVVDDPVNAKQADSKLLREAANSWWDGTMTTRFNNDDAAAVIVMQRLHDNDLSGHLLASEAGGDWHHLCLPAEYEPATQFTYPAEVRLPSGRVLPGDPRTEPAESIDPVRLGDGKRAELRRSLGTLGYNGQFQQRPTPSEGGMFKKDWWKRWVPTAADSWDRVVASWDMRFSDSQKASSSFVVGQVWGFRGADSYLLAQVRGRYDFTQTLHVFKALNEYRPDASAKLVEEKANGAAVISFLKRAIPGILPVQPQGGKDVRASAVSPNVESGNVWLPSGDTIPCPAFYVDESGNRCDIEPTRVDDFIAEGAAFPLGVNDDQVDAMSQAITWAKPRASTPSPTTPRVQAARPLSAGIRSRAI